MNPGTLYVAATPLGNLGDVSQRLLEILKSADVLLAEDTRVLMRLLNHFEIKKKVYSYHDHSSGQKELKIIEELQKGLNYALVSDAGTPVISDPGDRLVDLALKNDIPVIPIPGPCAVTTLLSVAGVRLSSFHFWGFFPIKAKKQRQIVEFIDTIPGVHLFYESPYRVLKTLEKHFAERDDLMMCVGREMTKKFETYYRGLPKEVLDELKASEAKGEFCLAVWKQE